MPEYSKRPAPRSLRVADQVKRIIGHLLDNEVKLPQVDMLTVTRVEMSNDLKHAGIYVSLLNPVPDNETVIRSLRGHNKELRYLLGSQLQAKYVPAIKFFLDESIEQSARIHAIIEELEQKSQHG